MLTRSTQIGEVYIMQPPQADPATGAATFSTKFTCDIMIYDEESDRHVRISWEEAMLATCVDYDKTTSLVASAAAAQ